MKLMEENKMKNRLYNILEEIIPGTDLESADTLVDSKILTSLNIVKLVSRLNEEFDIEITPVHLLPENFNSADAMLKLIDELDGE